MKELKQSLYEKLYYKTSNQNTIKIEQVVLVTLDSPI